MRLCKVARFCAIFAVLRFFVRFCALFSCQNGLQKSANLRIIAQKCASKRFYAIPPLVIPPFACHRCKSFVSLYVTDLSEIPPAYRETGVAIPLSHCVFCGIAGYRCYTPTSFCKMAYRSPKTGLTRGASQKKLASEAYRAVGGVARNSIANRAIVGY